MKILLFLSALLISCSKSSPTSQTKNTQVLQNKEKLIENDFEKLKNQNTPAKYQIKKSEIEDLKKLGVLSEDQIKKISNTL